MNKIPTIETDRLKLRVFEISDGKRVQFLAGNVKIADVTANIPHPYTDGLAEEWISQHEKLWNKKDSTIFAITLKNDGVLIGSISIMNIHDGNGEVGFWIGEEYWNKGYCTEACRALIDFGFQSLDLNRLYAEHLTRNPASGQVLKKVGFIQYDNRIRTCGYRQEKEPTILYELFNS